jgi:hypothetical protein
MSNATQQSPVGASSTPAAPHPEQPAQHTEGKEAQQDRHGVDPTQTAAPANAVPPCPQWCTLAPGHDYTGALPDGAVSRGHGFDVGPVEIGAVETRTPSGVIEMGALEM